MGDTLLANPSAILAGIDLAALFIWSSRLRSELGNFWQSEYVSLSKSREIL